MGVGWGGDGAGWAFRSTGCSVNQDGLTRPALKITRHMPQRHEGGNDGDDADAGGGGGDGGGGGGDDEALKFRVLICLTC